MRRTWRAAAVKAGVSVSLCEGTKHPLGTAIKAAGGMIGALPTYSGIVKLEAYPPMQRPRSTLCETRWAS
jgi:hypothetical protein